MATFSVGAGGFTASDNPWGAGSGWSAESIPAWADYVTNRGIVPLNEVGGTEYGWGLPFTPGKGIPTWWMAGYQPFPGLNTSGEMPKDVIQSIADAEQAIRNTNQGKLPGNMEKPQLGMPGHQDFPYLNYPYYNYHPVAKSYRDEYFDRVAKTPREQWTSHDAAIYNLAAATDPTPGMNFDPYTTNWDVNRTEVQMLIRDFPEVANRLTKFQDMGYNVTVNGIASNGIIQYTMRNTPTDLYSTGKTAMNRAGMWYFDPKTDTSFMSSKSPRGKRAAGKVFGDEEERIPSDIDIDNDWRLTANYLQRVNNETIVGAPVTDTEGIQIFGEETFQLKKNTYESLDLISKAPDMEKALEAINARGLMSPDDISSLKAYIRNVTYDITSGGEYGSFEQWPELKGVSAEVGKVIETVIKNEFDFQQPKTREEAERFTTAQIKLQNAEDARSKGEVLAETFNDWPEWKQEGYYKLENGNYAKEGSLGHIPMIEPKETIGETLLEVAYAIPKIINGFLLATMKELTTSVGLKLETPSGVDRMAFNKAVEEWAQTGKLNDALWQKYNPVTQSLAAWDVANYPPLVKTGLEIITDILVFNWVFKGVATAANVVQKPQEVIRGLGKAYVKALGNFRTTEAVAQIFTTNNNAVPKVIQQALIKHGKDVASLKSQIKPLAKEGTLRQLGYKTSDLLTKKAEVDSKLEMIKLARQNLGVKSARTTANRSGFRQAVNEMKELEHQVKALNARYQFGSNSTLSELTDTVDIVKILRNPDNYRKISKLVTANKYSPLKYLTQFANPSTKEGRMSQAVQTLILQNTQAQQFSELYSSGFVGMNEALGTIMRDGANYGKAMNIVGKPEVLKVMEKPSMYHFDKTVAPELAKLYRNVSQHPKMIFQQSIQKQLEEMIARKNLPLNMLRIPGAEWFHRELRSDIERNFTPGGGKFQIRPEQWGRFYTDVSEGYAKGVPYDANVELLFQHHIKNVYTMAAERNFAKYLGQEFQGAVPTGFSEINGFPALSGWAFPDAIVNDMKMALKTSPIDPFTSMVSQSNSLLRTLKAGLDLGVGFLHGQVLLAYRPDLWAKTMKDSLVAMAKEDSARNYIWKNREVAEDMILRGRNVFNSAEFMEGLNLIDKTVTSLVPPTINKYSPIKAFERQFNFYLDMARVELWKSQMWKNMDDLYSADLGAVIDNMMGTLNTSKLGMKPYQKAVESAYLSFSARYRRAGFAFLGDVFHNGIRGQVAGTAMARYLAGGMAAYYAFSKALGQEPDINTTSSEFMTVNINGTQVGLGGQYKSMLKLIGNIQRTAQENPERFISIDPRDEPLLKWFRAQGAPAVGIGMTMITGETYIGESVKGWDNFAKNVALESITPFWIDPLLQNRPNPQAVPLEFFGTTTWIPTSTNRLYETMDKYSNQLYGMDSKSLKKENLAAYRELSTIPEISTLERAVEQEQLQRERGDETANQYTKWRVALTSINDWRVEQLTKNDNAYIVAPDDIIYREGVQRIGSEYNDKMKELQKTYPLVYEAFNNPPKIDEHQSVLNLAYYDYIATMYKDDSNLEGQAFWDKYNADEKAWQVKWKDADGSLLMKVNDIMMAGKDFPPIYKARKTDMKYVGQSGYFGKPREEQLVMRQKDYKLDKALYMWGYSNNVQTQDAADLAKLQFQILDVKKQVPIPIDTIKSEQNKEALRQKLEAMVSAAPQNKSVDTRNLEASAYKIINALYGLETDLRNALPERQGKIIDNINKEIAKLKQLDIIINNQKYYEPQLEILKTRMQIWQLEQQQRISRLASFIK